MPRYAYLGPEATFAEQALLTLPEAREAELVPARGVPEALDAVRAGEVDAALVPIENSVEGSVPVTLDELATGEALVVVREVVLPVTFVLAGRQSMTLPAVRTVASHPHALAQCRRWLRENLPAATAADALSTAAAATAAAAGEVDAGICAPLAADRNGLAVLAADIGDRKGAVTRFVLATRPRAAPAPTGDDVTSLAVFIAHDRVGALLAVLTELAVRGVNLTRIESRPTGERLGRYVFFLDCSGHIAEARMGEALSGLHRVCADVRFIGSYPRAGHDGPIAPPPGATDGDFADAAAWLARLRAGNV